MPKSSKRKKEKVADFSKAKLKLGKGKAPASNAIDTSFKARSIALPSQSIAIEKDASEPVTKRQLTFGDLLSNLKHYNAGTRKDALLGLRELLDSNWDMVDSCLTPLLNALVRIISDEVCANAISFQQTTQATQDASVRKQLLWLLAWLLPRIPSDDLVPHSSLLLLFTTSAQTHIFPEIRIDAVRSLDILLECIPETTVDGWCEKNSGHGSRILEGYLGILNAGTRYGEADGPLKATSTASVVLTPASKLVVLRSLATFLQKALSPQEAKSRGSNSFDSSFMMNAFPTSDAYHSFESLFGSCETKSIVRKWQPEVTADDEGVEIFTQSYPLLEQASGDAWTLQELELVDENAGLNGSQQGDASFVAHLAKTLHSTIIETYLDCAPSVFSPGSSPSETELQLILTVARIAQSLYHKVMHSSENVDHEHIAHLESIVNYMAPYFPASSRDSKVEPAYEEFNLIFCQLSALLIIAAATQTDAPAPPRPHQKRRATRNRPNTTPLHAEQVTRYIARRLRGEAASSAQMGVAISPAAYNALLPTVWALISSRGGTSAAEVDAVFHATLDHAVRVSSKSACKRPTIEFVGRLLMLSLDPHRESLLVADKDADIKAKFESWYLHLPQVLWELGSTNVPCSQTILRVLLRVLQRRPKTAQAEILASLHSRLIPYFHIDHPHRGAVPGPYKKLPPLSASRVRLLALDVVSTVLAMGRQEGQDFEGLSRAVGLAVAGEDEYDYWTHISAVPCTNIKR
ncbi:hypothetical protein CVT26_002131 [Gymnopilus dilepis]|uniref:Pre-rRNA-processing protein n=1 Tax=Gymnopilus dilepis TaxID=231916 RepID=A0A409VBP4_9AGAR|nr:hypothetical protein CVT26_002131 [Gymnopilus dilepis]